MFVVAVVIAIMIVGFGLGTVSPSHALGALGTPARYAGSPLDQTQVQSMRPAWGNRAGAAASGTGGGGGFDLSGGIGFEFSGPHYARGVYREATLDLAVKVAGGFVKIRRLWQGGRWTFNPAWSPLRFDYWDNGNRTGFEDRVRRLNFEYRYSPPAAMAGRDVAGASVRTGAAGIDVGDYQYRTGGKTISRTDNGYIWRDRRGHWIDYDEEGRARSYGGRHGVTVTFERNLAGDIEAVFDKHGRRVLQIDHDEIGQPQWVQDHAGRRVEYRYQGSDLVEVVDVRGQSWRYGYEIVGDQKVITSRTGPLGRVASFEHQQTPSRRVCVDGQGLHWVFDEDTRRWEAFFQTCSTFANTAATVIQTGATVGGVRRSYAYFYDARSKNYTLTTLFDTGTRTDEVFNPRGETIRREINGVGVYHRRDDGGENVRTITDENDQVHRITYDQWGSPTRIEHADGSVSTIKYEPHYGNIVEESFNGRVTRYAYDEAGNRVRMVEAPGTAQERITEYDYDEDGNRVVMRRLGDAETATAEYRFEYDDHGNAVSVTDPEGQTSTYTYNALGQVLTITDRRNHVWRYRYDNAGNLTRATDPLGRTRTFEYDTGGRLVKAINPEGEITDYRYTKRDNLQSVTSHHGYSTKFIHDGQDRLLSVTDALGKQVFTRVYDAEGRVTSRRDGNGNTVSYAYAPNPSGRGVNYRPTKIIYPTYERYLTYDRANRLTRDTVVLDGDDGRVESYAYDRSGNLIRYTNADGQSASYVYDALNRPYAYTSPLGETISVVYDNRDNIVSITDPRGHTTRYTYDRNDRVTSETDPLGQTLRYAYDPSGNTVEITDARGQRRVYEYDEADQLRMARYFEAGALAPVQEIELTYDGTGRYETWDDGFASARYVYDKTGRLLSETVDYGGLSFTQSNTYYDNGLVETHTDPQGWISTFLFDQGNRISSIDLPGAGIVAINAYRWLAPERIILPGGVQQVYDWSDLLELENLVVRDPAATVISQLDYVHNKLGFVEERNQDGVTTHYGYDDGGRLTMVKQQGNPLSVFDRDAMGNRITGEGGVSNWVYNELNQLERRPGVEYDFDAAGNLISKTENGVVTRYVYDILHRLVRVEDGAGDVIAEYGYDPFDHRIWKEVAGVRTYYVYAGEGLVAEYDESGNLLVSYGYWPSSPWSTNPVYRRTGDDYAFFHTDHLATPTLLTDINGNVVWSASYDADGNATISPGATITNNLRFPGQYYDAETGLHYNLRRYYDPAIGRYITSDPIGVAGGLNHYLYAGGNPVRFFDPRGECVLVGAAVGAAVLSFKSWFCNVEYGWSSYAREALYGAACKADEALDLLRIARKRRPDPPNRRERESGRDGGNANQPCKASNSFVSDTRVLTEVGLKPISEIEAGDRVLAYSEWTGKTSYQEVTSVHAGESEYDIVTVTLINGEKIEATVGHPIYIFEKGWLNAAELKRGDRVVTDDLTPVLIRDIDRQTRTASVNNLSVVNARTFFVGASGVLVHNSRDCDDGNGDTISVNDFNQALNEALRWLNERGFKAKQPTFGKFGVNSGKPIGMKSADGRTGFRVENDDRNGPHINVFHGKEKGPHFTFPGNDSVVNQIIKRFLKER